MPVTDYTAARILIVDDEQSNLTLLERMLKRAGYGQLASVQDSREAMTTVESFKPDLILLDLMMPYVDGYEILQQLKERNDPYLPVMVLTADVAPQALERALSGGARDFLTKPFNQTELLLRVGNLLETRYLYLGMQQNLERLETFNEQAEHAIASRDAALSDLSHDIGQPLTAIRITTEMLRDQAGQDKAAAGAGISADLERIGIASDQMAAMIAEMSDLARLHMGRDLVLHLQQIDLVELLRKQVQLARRSDRRHRLRLETDLKQLSGRWDGIRLTRVVSNLISNAIKFSPRGGDVVVALQREGDEAVLAVSDQGVGIPESELPHVFDAFFRGSNVGRIDGSGIGLASTRKIVEQHGGTIDIESREGAGTTVRIRLPIS